MSGAALLSLTKSVCLELKGALPSPLYPRQRIWFDSVTHALRFLKKSGDVGGTYVLLTRNDKGAMAPKDEVTFDHSRAVWAFVHGT